MTTGDSSADAENALLFTSAMGRDGDTDCVRRLSSDSDDRNVLVVAYGRSPEAVLDHWRSRVGDEPTEFGIITVGGNERYEKYGLQPGDDGNSVSLADPASLGRLETAMRLYLDQWSANGRPTLLCFDSVSMLLRHVDRTTAFRFLHSVTASLRLLDVVAHFHIDPDAHDDATIAMFRSLFDVNGDTETPPTVSADVLSTLLGVPRRRLVCRYLCEISDAATASGIARQVATWERAGIPSRNEVERVHISLWHVHLPTLADVGVLELDGDVVSSVVERDVLQQYVRLTADDASAGATPVHERTTVRRADPPVDESDEAYWTVYGTASDSIVVTLARALGDVLDVPATELRPVLFDVIDIDALQRLSDHDDVAVYATFRYEGYEVVVDRGEIKLYESR